ncbi:MAG: hypothetical protein ACXWT7_12320 [Methylophilaceae bacterium]
MSNHYVFKSYVLDSGEIAGFRGSLTGVNSTEIDSALSELPQKMEITVKGKNVKAAEKLPGEIYQADLKRY